jgi:hypothetical protein
MRLSIILPLLILGLLSRPARAADEPDAALRDEGRRLYVVALDDIMASRWAGCRAKLLAAWTLARHHQVAANLAWCEMKLGLFRDAAEHAEFYRANAPAEKAERAAALLAEAAQHVGRVRILTEEGERAVVDDATIVTTGRQAELYLTPGAHRVRVGETTQTFNIGAGETKVVRLAASQTLRAVALGGGGVGVALLAVGAGFAVAANQAGESAAAVRAQLGNGPTACAGAAPSICTQLHADVHAQAVDARAGAGLLAAGGVLALGGAALAVVSRGRRAIVVRPMVGGLSVSGRW